MIDININTITKCSPVDIPEGELFLDVDGDVYIRTGYGAIRLEKELTFYSDEELSHIEEFPFFEECEIVKGKVSITVDIK